MEWQESKEVLEHLGKKHIMRKITLGGFLEYKRCGHIKKKKEEILVHRIRWKKKWHGITSTWQEATSPLFHQEYTDETIQQNKYKSYQECYIFLEACVVPLQFITSWGLSLRCWLLILCAVTVIPLHAALFILITVTVFRKRWSGSIFIFKHLRTTTYILQPNQRQ